MPRPNDLEGPEEDFLPPSWQFQGEAPEPEQPELGFWPVAERRRLDPLLMPLARTQDALARLETGVEGASPEVASGLRARVSLHEASGYLGHRHTTVHPRDLALHEAGLTGSYAAASVLGTLANELPWSFANGMDQSAAPKDWAVDQALHYARLWRHRGAHRPDRWHSVLTRFGVRDLTEDTLTEWAERLPNRTEVPGLLAAADVMARGMPNQGRRDHLDLASAYVAVSLWRLHGFGRAIALPFWSAPLSRIDALAQKTQTEFQLAYLECVAEAALRARRELGVLQAAERKAAALKAGGRSHLADATAFALREPVVTARGLADGIGVSTRSALDLLKRLMDEGLVREATGRSAWRAFVIEG